MWLHQKFWAVHQTCPASCQWKEWEAPCHGNHPLSETILICQLIHSRVTKWTSFLPLEPMKSHTISLIQAEIWLLVDLQLQLTVSTVFIMIFFDKAYIWINGFTWINGLLHLANAFKGVSTHKLWEKSECCNFQTITVMCIKVYIFGMEVSQRIHFFIWNFTKNADFWWKWQNSIYLVKKL